MEISNQVLDKLLDAMSKQKQAEVVPTFAIREHPKIIPEEIRPQRNYKLYNHDTYLFSKDGVNRVRVYAVFDQNSDGNAYRVDATNKTYASQKMAIKGARKWLHKKRVRFYKKNPKLRPHIKAVRLIPKEIIIKRPVILKLYKMDKEVAKILFRMSNKKLKIHEDYSRKKFDNKKTTAVSGDTSDFNMAIVTVLKDGTKKERKQVAKMLRKFTSEKSRTTNMFY